MRHCAPSYVQREIGIAICFKNVYNDVNSVFSPAVGGGENRDFSTEARAMKDLLQLLEDDCTLTHAQLAAMTGMAEDEVAAAVAQ